MAPAAVAPAAPGAPAAVAPAAGAGCQDTGFLSFLPSELLWALSTPACFRCCPSRRLYWLARSSLAPPPGLSEHVVSVAVGWLRACGFQGELTGLSQHRLALETGPGGRRGRIRQQRTFWSGCPFRVNLVPRPVPHSRVVGAVRVAGQYPVVRHLPSPCRGHREPKVLTVMQGARKPPALSLEDWPGPRLLRADASRVGCGEGAAPQRMATGDVVTAANRSQAVFADLVSFNLDMASGFPAHICHPSPAAAVTNYYPFSV